jgi:putative transposase
MTETHRRHVRRSRSDWQQLIDEQARSGQSQRAFCAARALSVKSFQHWKRQPASACDCAGADSQGPTAKAVMRRRRMAATEKPPGDLARSLPRLRIRRK